MPDQPDQYARWLLDPQQRVNIYFALNPCDWRNQDNCPSAAQALFEFLNDGQVPKRGGPQLPGRPAFCPAPGQGFVLIAPQSFSVPTLATRQLAGSPLATRQLTAIIELVRQGPPGNHVVIKGVRPSPQRQQPPALAGEHYASLVKLGQPEDDVFCADCSRPEYGVFYPSRHATHPGGWHRTIEEYLLDPAQRFEGFFYTRGPLRFDPQPIPIRSLRTPKQVGKPTTDILVYRPTDEERGLSSAGHDVI